MMELIVSVSGKVTASNLEEYKNEIFAQIDAIDTSLETKDDFTRAKQTIENLQAIENAIEETRVSAINETVDIRDTFKTMTEIADKVHATWGELEQRLKTAKKAEAAARKAERDLIVTEGIQQVKDYKFTIITESDFLNMRMFKSYDADIFSVAKGKKLTKTTREAVDPKVAECISEIKIEAGRIIDNYELLQGHSQSKYLFPDVEELIQKPRELLIGMIKVRVDQYELEQDRKKVEAERVAAEKVAAEKEAAEKVAAVKSVENRVVSEKTGPPIKDNFLPEDGQGPPKEYPPLETEKAQVCNSTPEPENKTFPESPDDGGHETRVKFTAFNNKTPPPVTPVTDKYILSVEINGSVNKAKEIANALDKAISHYEEIPSGGIRLTKA